MHQVATTPSRIPQTIARKLNGLRQSARIWLLVHSLGRLLALVVVICLADALIDWLFRMDRPQRLLVGLIVVSGLTYYLLRYVISPLTAAISDEALCQRVEKTNPLLAQRLISAVEFSQIGDLESLGVSPAMVDATIEEGTQMASEINFKYSLRRDAMQQNVVLLVIGIAGVAAIATAVVIGGVRASRTDASSAREELAHTVPGLADIWFNRNVLLGSKQWPQNTYLEVLGVNADGKLVFPRGDDKKLVVLVTEDSLIKPDIVYIEMESSAGSKKIQMNAEKDGKQFTHVFKNVLTPFYFTVNGGDHHSDRYEVILQPRPEIDALDLILTPPAYTGLEPMSFSREQSPLDVLPGSALRVTGVTSQPVRDSGGATLLGAKPATQEPGADLGIAMTVTDGEHIEGFIDASRLKPGEYRIRLENVDGLESKLLPLFNIRGLADESPGVAARLRGISSLITEQAVVPIEGRYTDDFAVDSVRLVHRWHGDSENPTNVDGSFVPPDIADKLKKKSVEHTFRFEVRDLKLPVGARLRLELEAKDNDTVSGPKTRLSDPFYLTVVTPDALRDDMLRREKDHRIEFERMINEQESLSDLCRTVLAQGDGRGLMTDVERREHQRLAEKKAADLSPEDTKRLLQLQKLAKASDEIPQLLARAHKLQGRIPRRLMAMADRFEAISMEAANNRLEDKEKHFSQIIPEQITEPLRTLGREQIDPAVKAVESARYAVNNAATRDEHLATAIAAQEDVLKKMQEILKYMVKSEGYQDAVNLLRKIKILQEKLSRETEAARDADLENIFGDDDDDNDEAEPKEEKKKATEADPE